MGQKINPISFRIGISENWRSRWYANKQDFGKYVVQDAKIRKLIKTRYRSAAISMIIIERTGEEVRITLHTARPGIVIGRRGSEIDKMRDQLEDICTSRVQINVQEVTQPETNAQLIAESIADDVAKRSSYKRSMKRAAETAMSSGAEGVRIRMAGRLAGSEMARTDVIRLGKIPLQTIRAKVDYGFTEAPTQYGHIGIKVWTYCGEEVESIHGSNAKTS